MASLFGLLHISSVNAGGFVLGSNYGIATGGENAASLNAQLQANGIIATASTSGDIRTAWQGFVAYQPFPGWGVELAYVDLGEATISFGGIDQDIGDILDKIGDNHPRSAQGPKLSASYRFVLNKSLQLQSKLGVFSWESDYTFGGVTDMGEPVSRDVHLSGTDVSFGFGLVHNLTNDVSAHLDWDSYSIDGEAVNMFTLGVSYLFH